MKAHGLSIPEDHGSDPDRGEIFPFHYLVAISWLPLSVELFHDYAKWLINIQYHLKIKTGKVLKNSKVSNYKRIKQIKRINKKSDALG